MSHYSTTNWTLKLQTPYTGEVIKESILFPPKKPTTTVNSNNFDLSNNSINLNTKTNVQYTSFPKIV